jgi:hypothetical protein
MAGTAAKAATVVREAPLVEVPVVEVAVVKEVPRVVGGTPLHPRSNHCKCPDWDLYRFQPGRRCCQRTSLHNLAEDRTTCSPHSWRTAGLGQVTS